jgi:hypothetical protein
MTKSDKIGIGDKALQRASLRIVGIGLILDAMVQVEGFS